MLCNLHSYDNSSNINNVKFHTWWKVLNYLPHQVFLQDVHTIIYSNEISFKWSEAKIIKYKTFRNEQTMRAWTQECYCKEYERKANILFIKPEHNFVDRIVLGNCGMRNLYMFMSSFTARKESWPSPWSEIESKYRPDSEMGHNHNHPGMLRHARKLANCRHGPFAEPNQSEILCIGRISETNLINGEVAFLTTQ